MYNAVRTVHWVTSKKNLQIRKAKLFEFNEKHFFLVWKWKKTVGKLFRTDINSGNSYCTILIFSAHSDVALFGNKSICFMKWSKKRFKVYHNFGIRNVVLYSKIMASQYHFIKPISLLFWSVSEYFYLATSST